MLYILEGSEQNHPDGGLRCFLSFAICWVVRI